MVYAPRDDDSVIRLEIRPKTDKMLRFGVGQRVECNLGDFHWERGEVIALNYYNEGGVISPYHVQLDSGNDVFAPGDDDDVIRLESRPTSHPRLRFAVGQRVECNLGDHWESGTVKMLMYYMGGGKTSPYQVQLDSGGGVFAPTDDDSVIRLPSRTAAAQAQAGAQTQLSASTASAARGSKLAKRRVGRQASTIGMSLAGSKLGGAKGKPQRAAAHKSALPESREEALARWRAVSEREL